MNYKIIFFTTLLITGCHSNNSMKTVYPVNNIGTSISSEDSLQYSRAYEEAHSFFEKHPDYKQDAQKENILFSEFSKLLKQEKYHNFSLSQLLEIAHKNI
ncbi:TPA: hypothetical protein O3H02_004256 [Salmonella enterica subsp. enterica serovar Saintpaul str. CFSAN004144]|nr:hypothetical protein [Salmonella enterica subsp. enterica serovar Saintpaul str. CFSAN004144]